MIKKIAVLGSTGSIGKSSLKIIKKKIHLFSIETLVANKNFKEIINQVKEFKPKNFIINDYRTFLKVVKHTKNKKTHFHYKIKNFSTNKIFYDFTIVAIPGLAGLEPTIYFTKKSKTMYLANKESIICGWSLINKVAKKNNVKITPLDSEHFSIMHLIKNHKISEIKKIYLTASGGPFLNTSIRKIYNAKPSEALKHPKWSMGKKISIDSATMMNKLFELCEAQRLFSIPSSKLDIIIHPQSLVHAIVKFKNGLIKFLYHEPNMTIPISNAIFPDNNKIEDFIKKTKENNIKNLEFISVDKKRFPATKLINKINEHISAPIIVNAANEILVDHYLQKKIKFKGIYDYLTLVLRDKDYKKYAVQKPSNLKKIYNIDFWARNKTKEFIEKIK